MADDKKLTPEDVEDKLDTSSTNPAVITEFADMDLSEFNEEDLKKLEGILGASKYSDEVYKSVKETIAAKIKDRREAIAKDASAPAPAEEKTGSDPTLSTPKEALEEMAPYDLHMEYNLTKELRDSAETEKEKAEHQAQIDKIVAIAKKKTEKMEEISSDNAPIFVDYYQIMKDNDPYFISSRIKDEKDLEVMLAQYDAEHKLPKDGELKREQVEENQLKWEEAEKEVDKDASVDLFANLKKDLVKIDDEELFAKIEKDNPEDWEQIKDMIKVSALTRLSVKEAGDDDVKVYIDEVNDVATEYGVAIKTLFASDKLNENRLAILNDDKVMAEFYEKEGMTKEQWTKQLEELQEKLHKLEKKTGKAGKDEYAEVKKQYDGMMGRITSFANLQLVRGVTSQFATRNEVLNNRIAQKAKLPHVSPRAHQMFKNATKSKFGVMAKQLLINGGINMAAGAVFGPAGLAAVSLVKTGIAVNKSYKRYKNTIKEGEKTSIKGFFKYLKENPNEKRALITQAALAASSVVFTGAAAVAGTLSYGAVGGALGANVAAIGTQMGLKKVVSAGISGISSAIAFVHANKDLVPLQKDLLSVLKKYDPRINETAKTGLFNKNPEKLILKDLQNLFKAGTEKEFYDKVKSLAPDITPSDMEKVVNLMSKIKETKSGRAGAAIGTLAAGAIITGFDTQIQGAGHNLFNGGNTDVPTEAPVVENAGAEAQTIETPVTEAPVVENAGAETQTIETPVVEAPTSETPTVEAQSVGAPVNDEYDPIANKFANRPGLNDPKEYVADWFKDNDRGMPTDEAPVAETPVAEAPVVENAGAETPTADTAVNEGAVEPGTEVVPPSVEAERLYQFDNEQEFNNVTNRCPTPIIKALQENGLWKEGQDKWSQAEWSSRSVREHLLDLQEKAAAGELSPEQMEGLKNVNEYMHNPQIYQDAHDVDAALAHIREAKEAARRAAMEKIEPLESVEPKGIPDPQVQYQAPDPIQAELAKAKLLVEHRDTKEYSTVRTEATGYAAAEAATREAAEATPGRDTFVVNGDESEVGFSKAKVVYNRDNTHVKTTLTHPDGSTSTMDKRTYEYGTIATGRNMASATIMDGDSEVHVTIKSSGTIGNQNFTLAKGDNKQDYLLYSGKDPETGEMVFQSKAISSQEASRLSAQMTNMAKNGYGGGRR